MSRRAYLVVGLVWVLSLVIVAVVAAGQATRFQPFRQPKVMSGADVGFRVEGMFGDQPAGAIVVRVKGKWVEARLAPVTGAPALVR